MNKLRIIPLGGCGEVGKNMTVLEYDNEIIIIDAGIMFPEHDMLGIDSVIPDFSYVRDNKKKVKAILITHGHEDHIGALTHLLKEINVPVYATPLTVGFIENKLRRAQLINDVKVNTITANDNFTLGQFFIEPFHVTHSIPNCVGFAITTPVGIVVHTGDYKFDQTPVDGWATDSEKLAEFGERGVLALLGDSTNAEQAGWTSSEAMIVPAFDKMFAEAQGRIIIASFASLISRIQLVANMAQKHKRALAITGRSMRDNVKMAQEMGYLDLEQNLLIDIGEVNDYPPHKVVIMATGSQGEPRAVLNQLASGRHRNIDIVPDDTVVLSAHTIPGNEESVHRIVNRLLQRDATVLYEHVSDLHVSGHASQDEMKQMISLVKPKFLIPIHGELRHLKAHGRLGLEMGIAEENIVAVENGTILELTEDSIEIKHRLPGGYVFVDGNSVGEFGWSVMRDRSKLAENGIFFVSINRDKAGNLIGQPEIVTRGFADLRNGSAYLLDGARDSLREASQVYAKSNAASKQIADAVQQYLYKETGRRPMVHVFIN